MAEEAPPPPMAVLTFEEAFERYVVRGTEETEGYFLLMAYMLFRSDLLTSSQKSMMKGHYGVGKIWLTKVTKMYNLERYRNDIEPLDVFNILNRLLGTWRESRWEWESQEAYDLMTMMYDIMVRAYSRVYVSTFEKCYNRIRVAIPLLVPEIEDAPPPPPPAKRARVE
jgi:hypothetical protein